MTKLLITLHFAKVMSSIKETRNLLLVSCVTGIMNANEFAILYNVNMSKNPLFLYDNYEEFSLDNFSKEKCITEFRVEKNDLPVLADALFSIVRRGLCLKEGLCILFKRLAYHCRYNDMIPPFGRPVPEISMMTNVVLDWIYNEHGHHLTHFNQFFLFRASLRTYADAIHQKGAALNNCWGFVDGTVCPICHPLKNQ